MDQDISARDKVYFISDAHLRIDESPSPAEEKLLMFFGDIREHGSHLYIVGDLFDFWFEYKYAVPAAYLKVLAGLQNLTASGIKVFYVPGNHDFWMRDFLKRQAGIELTGDLYEAKHWGKRLLITHGDGLRKDDVGYRFIKRIFRNRVSIWLYSQLPVNVAYRLAMGSSRASRQYTTSRNKKDPKDYIEFASKQIEKGYNAVVMGHLHVPQIEDLGKGLYVNCGDFFEHFSYVVLDEEGIHLESMRGNRSC
jgi:UDP-2,3-diacylglucosamine hydrolase